jgi:hydroxymethylpyrimidine pyrophosphatase-like HAD family hydrolase
MPSGNNKGNAVMFLANYLNINHRNVLVVGDEKNDISMLEKFEHSVTLASSDNDVRKTAGYVIDAKPSVVVKKAIQKIIFDNEQ